MKLGPAARRNHTLTLALFALVGCAASEAAQPAPLAATRSGSSGAVAWASLKMVAAGACPVRWSDNVGARVAFDERHTSRVSVPLAGRITQVFVERGQQVAAGAPLFVVASADLADLRGQRDKAVIELATARTTLERVRALVLAKSLPAKELVGAEQAAIEAQLAVSTAEQKLASLRVGAVGDTAFTVTAPRAGVVVEHHITVGQEVAADAPPLLAIADVSDVWIFADLLDDATHELHVGSPARVTLDGDAVVPATIDEVSAIVDPDRHAVPVRLHLDNAAGTIRPGAYAEVQFEAPASGGICIPAAATLSDGSGRYVYIQEAGELRRRRVVAAPPLGTFVAIREGLVVGDMVVTEGAGLLDNQLPAED